MADTFEELKCWQLAYELKVGLKKDIIGSLPASERFELKSQMLRASRSVTANIAEGWGRFHYLDSNKFYYNARGSLSELLDHLIEARYENYIAKEVYIEYRDKIQEAIKVLNGFIFYLKKEHLKNK
jgi:four helix bundle protein